MGIIKKYTTIDGQTGWHPFSASDAEGISTIYADSNNNFKSVQVKLDEHEQDISKLKRNVAWLALHGGGGSGSGGGGGGGGSTSASCSITLNGVQSGADENHPASVYLKTNNDLVITLNSTIKSNKIPWKVIVYIGTTQIASTSIYYTSPTYTVTWSKFASYFSNYKIGNVRISASYEDDDNAIYGSQTWYGQIFNTAVSLKFNKTSYTHPVNDIVDQSLTYEYSCGQTGSYKLQIKVKTPAGVQKGFYETTLNVTDNTTKSSSVLWTVIFGVGAAIEAGSYNVTGTLTKVDDPEVVSDEAFATLSLTSDKLTVICNSLSATQSTPTQIDVNGNINFNYVAYKNGYTTFNYSYYWVQPYTGIRTQIGETGSGTLGNVINEYYSIYEWAYNYYNKWAARADYSTSKTYEVGDFCFYTESGKKNTYQCKEAISSPQPWNPSKWERKWQQPDEYSTTKNYPVGSYCMHSSQIYKCITEITYSGEPHPWNDSEWTPSEEPFKQDITIVMVLSSGEETGVNAKQEIRYIQLVKVASNYIVLSNKANKSRLLEFNSRAYNSGANSSFDFVESSYNGGVDSGASYTIESTMTMIKPNNLTGIRINETSGQPYFRLCNGSYAKINNFSQTNNNTGIKQIKTFPQFVDDEFTISICYKADYHPDDTRSIFTCGIFDSNDDTLLQGVSIDVHGIYIGGQSVAKLTHKTVNMVDISQSKVKNESGTDVYLVKIFVDGVLSGAISRNTSVFRYDSGSTLQNAAIYFGGRLNDSTNPVYLCDVDIYNFQLYTRALDDLDILGNYVNNKISTSYSKIGGQPSTDSSILTDQLGINLCTLNVDGTISSSIYTLSDGYRITPFLDDNTGLLSVTKLNSAAKDWGVPVVLIDVSTNTAWTFNNFTSDQSESRIPTASNCRVEYWDPTSSVSQTSLVVFEADVDTQGTSTLSNAIKNVNISINSKYLFTPKASWFPETTYTLKADIVDSSHSNNAAIGGFINNSLGYTSDGSQTPFFKCNQKAVDNVYTDSSASVRNYKNGQQTTATLKHTVEGFPVFLIMRFSGDGTIPLGIYSFNLGRDSYRNLGFTAVNSIADSNGSRIPVNNFPYRYPASNVGELVTSQPPTISEDTTQDNVWVEINATTNCKGMNAIVPDLATLPSQYMDTETGTRKNCEFTSEFWQPDTAVFSQQFSKRYPKGASISSDSNFYAFVNQIAQLPLESLLSTTSQGERQTQNVLGSYQAYTVNSSGSFTPKTGETITLSDNKEAFPELLFSSDSMYTYFAICLLFGLVDNFGKNTTYRRWGNGTDTRYFVDFYDMDTALGGDNQGNLDVKPDFWLKYISNYDPDTINDFDSTKNYSKDTLVYRWENNVAKLYKCKADISAHAWVESEWTRISYETLTGDTEYKLGYASESFQKMNVCKDDTGVASTTMSSNQVPSAPHNKIWLSIDSPFFRSLIGETSSRYSEYWWMLRNKLDQIAKSHTDSSGNPYTNFVDYFVDEIFAKQTGNCGSLIYNYDYKLKYLLQFKSTDTAINTSSISRLHGRKIAHTRDWLKKHILFLDSIFYWRDNSEKANYTDFRENMSTSASINVYKTPKKFPIKSNTPLVLYNGIGDSIKTFYWIQENQQAYINAVGIDENVQLWRIYNSPSIIELGNKDTKLSAMGIGSFKYENVNTNNWDPNGLPALTELLLNGNNYFESASSLNSSVFSQGDVSELRTLNLNGATMKGGVTSIIDLDFSGEKFSKLQYVDINNATCINSVTFPVAPMTYLDVANSLITTFTLSNQKYVSSIELQTCTKLKSVNINNCDGFENFQMEYSLDDKTNIESIVLQNCKNLKNIVISNCTKLNSLTISACPNLESIRVTGCTALTSNNLTIESLQSLKTLNLNGNTALTYVTISNMKNPHLLTTLNLSNTKISYIKGNINYDAAEGYLNPNDRNFYQNRSGYPGAYTYSGLIEPEWSVLYIDKSDSSHDVNYWYGSGYKKVTTPSRTVSTVDMYYNPIDKRFYQIRTGTVGSYSYKSIVKPSTAFTYKDKATDDYYEWDSDYVETNDTTQFFFGNLSSAGIPTHEVTYNGVTETYNLLDLERFWKLSNLNVQTNAYIYQIQFANIENEPVNLTNTFSGCTNLYRVYGNVTIKNCGSMFYDKSKFSIHGTNETSWLGKLISSGSVVQTVWKILTGENEPGSGTYDYAKVTINDTWQEGRYKTNLRFYSSGTNVLSSTFRATSITQFDVYYALAVFALCNNDISSNMSASYTFRGNKSIFSWKTGNQPNRYTFYGCNKITSLDWTFTTATTYLYSPAHTASNNGRGFDIDNDNGFFSPLTGLASMDYPFSGNVIYSKHLFRRKNTSSKYPLSSISRFYTKFVTDCDIGPILDDSGTVQHGLNNFEFTNVNNYTWDGDTVTDVNHSVSSVRNTIRRCTGNFDSFFSNRNTNNNLSIYDSFSCITLNFNTLNFPTKTTSIDLSFNCSYARGLIDLNYTPATGIGLFANGSILTNLTRSFNIQSGNTSFYNDSPTSDGKVIYFIAKNMFANIPNLVRYGSCYDSSESAYGDCFVGSGVHKKIYGDGNITQNGLSGFADLNSWIAGCEDILRNLTNLVTFTGFYNNLESRFSNEYIQIPGNLFLHNPQLKNIYHLAYNCNQIFELTPDGFRNCPVLLDVTESFYSPSTTRNAKSTLQGEIPYRFFYHGKSSAQAIKYGSAQYNGTVKPTPVWQTIANTDSKLHQTKEEFRTQILRKPCNVIADGSVNSLTELLSIPTSTFSGGEFYKVKNGTNWDKYFWNSIVNGWELVYVSDELLSEIDISGGNVNLTTKYYQSTVTPIETTVNYKTLAVTDNPIAITCANIEVTNNGTGTTTYYYNGNGSITCNGGNTVVEFDGYNSADVQFTTLTILSSENYTIKVTHAISSSSIFYSNYTNTITRMNQCFRGCNGISYYKYDKKFYDYNTSGIAGINATYEGKRINVLISETDEDTGYNVVKLTEVGFAEKNSNYIPYKWFYDENSNTWTERTDPLAEKPYNGFWSYQGDPSIRFKVVNNVKLDTTKFYSSSLPLSTDSNVNIGDIWYTGTSSSDLEGNKYVCVAKNGQSSDWIAAYYVKNSTAVARTALPLTGNTIADVRKATISGGATKWFIWSGLNWEQVDHDTANMVTVIVLNNESLISDITYIEDFNLEQPERIPSIPYAGHDKGNVLNYMTAPDIFRYSSNSTTVTINGFFMENHYTDISFKFGITGRICPYLIYPISGTKDISYMFAGCRKLSSYQINVYNTSGIAENSYVYQIPPTFFKYANSVNTLNYTFAAFGFIQNTSLNVFSYLQNNSIDIRCIFECCHYFAESGTWILTQAFTNNKISSASACFSLHSTSLNSGSIYGVSQPSEYSFYSSQDNETGYSRPSNNRIKVVNNYPTSTTQISSGTASNTKYSYCGWDTTNTANKPREDNSYISVATAYNDVT